MANEIWVNHDMAKGLVDPHQLAGLTYTGSNAGDTFGVHILRNGVPSTELSGRTVTGYLIRPDQQTVVISGAISGSDVTVTLPSEAYAYSGRCSLVIRVSDTHGVKIPVFAAYFNIGVTSTDETIDPGELIPSLEDLLAQIDAMEAATNTAQLLIANYEDRMSVAVVRSVNLYNKTTRNIGLQLYADGSEHSNADYDTSDYIPVTPSVRYYAGYWVDGDPGAWGTSQQVISICAFYDASKTLITPTIAADVLRTTGAVAPANAAFMRLSINRGTITNASERVMVVESALPAVYAGYWTLTPEITEPISELEAAVREMGESVEIVNDELGTIDSKTSLPQRNLINPASVVVGKSIDNSGNLIDSTEYSVTDYIPCEYGEHYYFSFLSTSGTLSTSVAPAKFVYYSGEKVRLGQSNNVNNREVNVEGTKYLRIVFKTTWLSNGTMSLTIGWCPTTTSEFCYYVDKFNFFRQISNVSTQSELIEALKYAYIINVTDDIEITEELTIDRNVIINGNGHSLTGSGLTRHLVVINSCDVTINCLTLQNGANSVMTLIGTYNAIITDCTICQATDSVLVPKGNGTLNLRSCEIYGSASNDGIAPKENARVFIYDCKIHDNYDEGLSSHNSSYCEVYDSEFYNNGYIIGTTDRGAASSFGGCHLGGGRMGIVSGCYSHHNRTYGIALINFQDDTQADIERCWNNICIDNGSAGIWVTGARNLILSNNTIVGNGGDAIHFGLDTTYTPTIELVASAGYVTGNKFAGNGHDNIVIDSGADNGIVIVP